MVTNIGIKLNNISNFVQDPVTILKVKSTILRTFPDRAICRALQMNSMIAMTNAQKVPVNTRTNTPPTFLSSRALVEGALSLSQNLSMFLCFHHLSYIA